MGEFSGWEEDVGWDVRVEDDGVCINPPVYAVSVLVLIGKQKEIRTSTILLFHVLVLRVLERLVGS
jgi:hypothetical protein